MTWSSMESAPKDGQQILVAYDNGCSWNYYVVWWNPRDSSYPWYSYHDEYPEGRFHYWRSLMDDEPYEIDDGGWWCT